MHQVCECHRFGCEQVGPGVAGTYPTFIVQQAPKRLQETARPVVVKFFGPLFDGAASFLVERDMGRWIEEQSLAIPSPAILAEGRLDDDWQYLVFEHIEWVSIGRPGRRSATQIGAWWPARSVIISINCIPLQPVLRSGCLIQSSLTKRHIQASYSGSMITASPTTRNGRISLNICLTSWRTLFYR